MVSVPKKYTLEEIKNIVDKKSNSRCEVLSNEYINSRTKMLFKCQCGNVFERTFNKLIKGTFLCNDCLNEWRREKYSNSLEEVKETIKKYGCEYVSGDYKNTKSLLIIKCSCGNLFKKDMQHFIRQHQCVECGKEKLRRSKLKYDIEQARKIFATKGYVLIENEYIDCHTPMKAICKNGHNCSLILSQFLSGCSGCSVCATQEHSGEKHWNYKGGENEVLDALRKSIKRWKFDVLKYYNFQCYFTNSKKDVVVHHIKPFMNIVKESCEELNLPLHRKIKDYKSGEFEDLKNLVLSKHTINVGVVLQRKVHSKFHSIYGLVNNTEEQFKEFAKIHYNKNFSSF